MDDIRRITEIRVGPVPGPQTATSGELPLEPGHVQMAFPPPGGELVQAVTENGEITGYYRTRVEQCQPTAAEDFWADPDDLIPGEFQYELAIGDDFRCRDVTDFIVELKHRSPAQFVSMALAMADVVNVLADPAARN